MPNNTPNPRRMTRWMLTISLLGVVFYDFAAYRTTDPTTWLQILHGTAPAPQQYRVAIVDFAFFLSAHLHVAIAWCFTAIDLISALAAAFILLHLVETSPTYRKSPTELKYFANASFLFLLLFYLVWLFPQRPETLPSTLYVSLMLWLWRSAETLPARSIAVAIGLLALAFAQSWIRADVVLLLSCGALLVAISSAGQERPGNRTLAFATSLGAIAIALSTQAYLAKVLYPSAGYGVVKLWQLRPNLIHATRWPSLLIFMLPVAWTLFQFSRGGVVRNASNVALALGSVGYFVVWMCVGKADEVRIFIPFALGLLPLTINLLLARISPAEAAAA